MKKLLVIMSAALLLSGCSLTSTYTVASAGNVEATISFAVPKSTLRKVTTVDQWSQVLLSSNFPTPSISPSPGSSPGLSCAAGESLELDEWNYTCSALGDISLLSESSSSDSPANLKYSRDGKTLYIVQPASSTSGGSNNPFSSLGISLFSAKTTLTFPGLVTDVTVTGGAKKVDDHTVSFEVDQNQQTEMTATLVLNNEVTSAATSLDLTTKASALTAGSADVELTAAMTGSSSGQVTFFDGETLLGSVDVNEQGVSKYIAGTQPDGSHQYRAVFQPRDWWNVDTSRDQTSLTFKTFKMNGYPSISGLKKVGANLVLANLKSTPTANASYQWLRNGSTISGKTAKSYKVVAADFNKNLSVRITLAKTGYLPITFETSAFRITKR
jgi:hypothetical protein